ncbi:ENL/AF9-related superfamily elongation complex transcription factor [Megalopta genalis]|uniref:ENL/AF9-related superfamily elongation complex transcription factor n=1 Tax=Megalopta genalis TaxID=115081 RepID=UPI001443664D|nr:protein AF-9 [Megalopta genalis]
MAIRITLECGHSSTLRAHTTAEGYTHDWELFVRGVQNADIHHYVEKVVFQLHETFSKPKRVLKEPPFELKESGYAGFEIPIHIYLKNKDEGTKKIELLYDLHLQTSGPAIANVMRHTEIINNPSDEFRRKLLKGGGAIVSSSESSAEKSEIKTPTMVGKPKLSGSETKKHKTVESKTSNSFAELFGTPLKPTKVSQDTKKPAQPEKSSAPKPVVAAEKSEKVDKASKLKDSPHKDSKKEKIDDKKDKKLKDQSKNKNRSKDKSKRPSSPGAKSHSSPSNKRPPSPVSLKRPASPSALPPSKRPVSPKSKEKELKKPVSEKEKEKSKEKEKTKDSSKSVVDPSKSEKKKDKKKHKEDRDKERKDKYKEGERSASKESLKVSEKKSEKPEKPEKSEKEKSQEYKSTKDGRKSPKQPKEPEKPKEEKLPKVEKPEKTEKSEKPKDGKSEKDRQKHKHRKRDKKDKRDSSKERDKKEKRDRIKTSSEKQNNVANASTGNPLLALLSEMPERDSSDSAPSVDDDSFSEPKPVTKKEPENATVSTPPTEMPKPMSPAMPTEIKKEKVDRNKREKPKGSKGEEKEIRKRKRRSESKGDDEHVVKREKDRGPSTSPPLEPVSSSQSPVAVDQDQVHIAKEKEDRAAAEQATEKNVEVEAEQVAPDSTNSTLVDSEMGEPPVFSEDYVSQLKDLQQKIMTLQDNQELQRVVQVIAETGQYEITKKTFDFDLCALDRRTVQRLQQFFAS